VKKKNWATKEHWARKQGTNRIICWIGFEILIQEFMTQIQVLNLSSWLLKLKAKEIKFKQRFRDFSKMKIWNLV
jgi:hypothetical protein